MEELTFTTPDSGLLTITSDVRNAVPDGHDGAVLVFCPHTTASLFINEDEAGLRDDINDALLDLVPHSDEHDYAHDHGHDPNAHAHLKTVLTNSDLTIPVQDGELTLGTWQEIFLLDTDGPRQRTVQIQPLD